MSLKNKIINVICEKIVFPGRSLCKCDDGFVLFTEGLLPGEMADVLVIKDKKSFREGIVKQITQNSSKRISARCVSFGKCGGCTFQNTDYQTQAEIKYSYVCELLKPFNVEVSPILKSPLMWQYRNKMEFSFFNVENKVELGLHCRGSFNRYICVPPCYICDEVFIKACQIVKDWVNAKKLTAYNNRTHEGFLRHLVLRKAQNNNQFLINLVCNTCDVKQDFFNDLVKQLKTFTDSIYLTQNTKKSDAVLSDKTTLLFGKENITEKLTVGNNDYYFNISPFSFFQTNSKGTQILYNEILNLLKPSKDDTLLDLYCGTGTIGISLANNVKKLTGVEQVEAAIVDAKANAKLNKITNANFYAISSQDWVKDNKENFDLIVVDPPRSGLVKEVVQFLTCSRAKKIVYVSCNPSTLARDLAMIVESKKYLIKNITPVDMFAQTYHVETVVLLSRITPDAYITVDLDMSELDLTSAEAKATYNKIRDFVKNKYGFHVTNLNIAQVKQKYGIIERVNYNVGEGKSRVPNIPQEKFEAIEDALRFYKMI